MLEGYALYLKAIKNVSPMSEEQWKQAVGIKDEVEVHIPLIIIPKKDARPIRATFDNFIEQKVPIIKKHKVERRPRKKMSDEERKAKAIIYRKNYLKSEKGRKLRREINARYAERNREKLNAEAVRRYHENKL